MTAITLVILDQARAGGQPIITVLGWVVIAPCMTSIIVSAVLGGLPGYISSAQRQVRIVETTRCPISPLLGSVRR